MEYDKFFFEKVFSNKRMERYFNLYPNDEGRAIQHYQCNLQLSEALYVSLSVFEVTLRNALSRELVTMTKREDWYAIFPTTPGLSKLNKYINSSNKADCRKTRKHYSIKNHSRIDSWILGLFVEQ